MAGSRRLIPPVAVHPLIRLILFVAAAVAVPLAGVVGIAYGALLLALCWGLARQPLDRRAVAAVRRLRWLLLSLAVLYGWFTPGQYLVPAWGGLSPTWEGLSLGGQRAAVLLLIALGAHLLLASTPRERLIAALGLLQPKGSRFALRLVLTLEAVAPAQARLAPVLATGLTPAQRWDALHDALAEGEAGRLAPERVHAHALAWPAPRQWAWLLLLSPLGWS